MPKEYGNWHTIYVRFNRWSKKGTIDKIFEELQNRNIIEIRTEIICLDSTSIKVHPDAAGTGRANGEQSIGRSKGGLTTKIHLASTSAKYALTFHISPENKHDAPEGRKLLETIYSENEHFLLMDKHMKMIKQELLHNSKGLFLLCLQRRIEKSLGIMIKNFTKDGMKLKDIF